MFVCIYECVGETDLSNNMTYWCSLHWLPWRVFVCVRMCVFACTASYLVAVHHEVVGGDKGFEDHHPAGVGRALEQRVRQLGNVHVHLIGAVDQIWKKKKKKKTHKKSYTTAENKEQAMRKAF